MPGRRAAVGAQQGPSGSRRPTHVDSRRCCPGPDNGVRSAPRVDAGQRPIIQERTSAAAPAAGFDRFDLRPELLRAVTAAGFTAPRPIQVEALPAGLRGRDILGLAQTGTGKTAAFVLPILQRLLQVPPRKPGARALVVAPTRELASQVQADFARLSRYTQIESTAIFGGVPIPKQVRALRRRPEVLVACPGRLLDLLDRRALRLDAVEVLVLDEADHMFDMGFLPDVRRILAALPPKRQNLMFSATMPREIRKLADRILQDPVVVELASSKPAETIEHSVLPLDETEKTRALENLFGGDDFSSAIVFLRTKRRAKKLAEQLSKRGHEAVALQGNMSQGQRDRALRGFRDKRYEILVATDIAARGLDIQGVSHVVNFDVPGTPDAYTHRIGRTGRSEQAGKALTFVTRADVRAVRAIEKQLGEPIPRLTEDGRRVRASDAPPVRSGGRRDERPELRESDDRKRPAGRGRRQRSRDDLAPRANAGRRRSGADRARPAGADSARPEARDPWASGVDHPKKAGKTRFSGDGRVRRSGEGARAAEDKAPAAKHAGGGRRARTGQHQGGGQGAGRPKPFGPRRKKNGRARAGRPVRSGA